MVLASIDWGNGVEDAWQKVVTFVPKFAAFLVILLVGMLVAKAVAKALEKVLERVGFDRAVERGGIRKLLAQSKFDASDIIGKLAYYALALLVLTAAFGVFGANPISDMLNSIVAYLPKIIVAVVIVVVGAAIAAGLRELIRASIGALSYGDMLANAASVLVLGLAGFAALNQLEIAQEIVNGLFYAIIGSAAGIAVIAVGGGGIKPMQARWERMLQAYDAEKQNVARAAAGSGERIQQRAENLKNKANDLR